MAYRGKKKKDLQRRTGIPFLHAETAALKREEAAQETMGRPQTAIALRSLLTVRH